MKSIAFTEKKLTLTAGKCQVLKKILRVIESYRSLRGRGEQEKNIIFGIWT